MPAGYRSAFMDFEVQVTESLAKKLKKTAAENSQS